MKKILFIALLSTIVMGAQAQFGAKAGVNFSKWTGSDVGDEDVDGLVGMYFGFYYNIHCASHFSIQPELVYSGEGVKANTGGEKIKMKYMNLSVLARYNTPSGFFVGTGPQIGFLLSAKEEDVDLKDFFMKTNLSWALAMGYEWHCGFGLYARYNFGITKIIDDDPKPKVMSSCIQFGLRYNIATAKKK